VLVGDAGHGLHPIAGQGPQRRLARRRRAGRGDRRGMRPRARSGRRPAARALRALARDRHLHRRAGDRRADRLFGIPASCRARSGASAWGAVQRTPALKRWFMDEARGVSGKLPELLKG
jgi:2-octaprenyl-6-methoxyphenol hydroxylase